MLEYLYRFGKNEAVYGSREHPFSSRKINRHESNLQVTRFVPHFHPPSCPSQKTLHYQRLVLGLVTVLCLDCFHVTCPEPLTLALNDQHLKDNQQKRK